MRNWSVYVMYSKQLRYSHWQSRTELKRNIMLAYYQIM